MSDTLGLLELPMPAPVDDGTVGDPLLDVTLAYLQAVINSRTKLAWKAIRPYAAKTLGQLPTEPLPVSFVASHNPMKESFTTARLPALFAWRSPDHAPTTTRTQEWVIRASTLMVLWIPPRPTQAQAKLREAFKNAVSGAIELALHRGRDPSWKIEGDAYFDAQTYGSTYAQQAKLWRHRLRQIETLPVQLEDEDDRETIDGLLAQIDVEEILQSALDDFAPLDHVEGTVTTNGLATAAYTFKVGITSISPATGAAIGGTTVTIRGHQFSDDAIVTIGGVDCTDVATVDETTILATTGAHDADAVDVVVTNPSGASATLPVAFTYV